MYGTAIAAVGFVAFYVTLVLSILIGWVLNVVSLAGHAGEFTILEALRVVGIIFPPIGAILGWFF